jgi:hypothetical protein
MYETNEQPAMTMDVPVAASPQVIWMGTTPEAAAATREADPYDVINFLLKKVEDQQARISEHEDFAELQNQEIEGLKSELEAKRQELESTQAEYDVQLQNMLAVEHELENVREQAREMEVELEGHRNRQGERPKIQLPFHPEQNLAKLGYGDVETAAAAE